jgi:hypothetical protein
MGAIIKPMRHNRGRLPPEPCQAASASQREAVADGLKRLSGRNPGRPGPPNPSSCDRAPHRPSPRA